MTTFNYVKLLTDKNLSSQGFALMNIYSVNIHCRQEYNTI